jgi:hypothetical protein
MSSAQLIAKRLCLTANRLRVGSGLKGKLSIVVRKIGAAFGVAGFSDKFNSLHSQGRPRT